MRLRPATSRSCRPGSGTRLGNAAASPCRFLSLNSPQRLDAARRPTRHVLRGGRRTLPRWTAAATRPPFGDPTLRLVGHYDGTPPQLEALRVADDRPRPRARRHGHRAARVQRDLGEDARRPDVRRRPRDDVHRRLRARRRRPGARPPVRGGVLLPRRRDRGRARRRALHAARRATSCSPASARCTASTTPAPNGSAGSRPRRRSRRPGTRIAGAPSWERLRAGDTRTDGGSGMSDDGSVVVVGGTRAIGREIARHYATRGASVVLTGRDPGHVDAAVAELGGATSGRRRSTCPSRRRSRRPWPTSVRSTTSSWPPSTATTNSVAEYDITRAIRLVTLKLVGYTEVVHALLRPADRRTPRSCCSAAWPRNARTPARRR